MIKNDFRYIIKKIIIGIGIFIGIFYFKSCSVSALSNLNYHYETDITFNVYKPGGNESYHLDVNYSKIVDLSNFNYYLVLLQVNRTGDDYIKFLKSNQPFNVTGEDLSYYWVDIKNYNTFTEETCNLTTNFCTTSSRTGGLAVYTQSFYDLTHSRNVSNNWIILDGNYNIVDSNKTIEYYINGNYNEYVPPPLYSNIVSLNPEPILSDDESVLLGYNFTLEFDNFSTENFIYKYRIGTGRTLIFTNNNYQLSVRNNTTLYVWSEDLEGNVIDSETFTIVGVGDLYQGEYSIDFTYKDIAPSDTQNTTGLSNIIDRVDIDITYLPKTNKLKYQYQYVNSDGSLDPQNWVQLNNNNSLNNYTYVTHSNGTLYARILNEDDNVVANNTFTVDSIGKMKLFSENNNIGGFFDDIKKNINYTGPIYSLILMPINFLQTLYNGSNSVCQRYKIGTLFNHDIYFECVDLTDYIGSTLYNLLDVLSSSGVIYGIALFIKRKYNEFMNLNDNSNDIM